MFAFAFQSARRRTHAVHLAAATLLRVSAEGMGTALVLIVHARTGHAATAGFVQMAVMLPYVLSGPVTGNTLDRAIHPRTLLMSMVGCYVVAAGTLLAIVGNVPLGVALLVGAVVGCAEPVVVALTGLLPRFVPPDRLTRAYGLEASTYNLAAIVGPGIAAGLAAWVGAGYAAAAVVGSAAIGLTLLPLLAVPPPEPAHQPSARQPSARQPSAQHPFAGESSAQQQSDWRSSKPSPSEPASSEPASSEPASFELASSEPPPFELASSRPSSEPSSSEPSSSELVSSELVSSGAGQSDGRRVGRRRSERRLGGGGRGESRRVVDVVGGGLVALMANRVLRAVTVATTVAFLGIGGLTVSAVLLAQHRGATASAGGQLLAAFAVGALLGSLGAARWLSARIAEWVLVLGMVTTGLAFLAIALSPSVPVAAAFYLIAGVADGPVFAATLTVRQREAPPERLGQVNTTGGSLKIGSAALGAALTGALADWLGAPGLLAGMAVCQFVGAAVGLALLSIRPARAAKAEP